MLVLSNFLIVATGAGAGAFCMLYATISPWWRTALGRNIMALMGVIGLFLGLATMHMVWPHVFDSQQWIRPVMWSMICAIVWCLVGLLVRTQVRKRRGERDGR